MRWKYPLDRRSGPRHWAVSLGQGRTAGVVNIRWTAGAVHDLGPFRAAKDELRAVEISVGPRERSTTFDSLARPRTNRGRWKYPLDRGSGPRHLAVLLGQGRTLCGGNIRWTAGAVHDIGGGAKGSGVNHAKHPQDRSGN
ncbi:MAG: hypothetical protein JNL67_05720 [Planctomycetaceae bacterium]|nr:hypothetical protein [Planctomycetaceae bacterium]